MKGFTAGLLGMILFALPVHAEPISLHVADGDIRSVLTVIARLGGLGLVVDDEVRGKVSVELDDVEPEAALKSIAAAHSLVIEEQGGMFLVSSAKSVSRGMYAPYVFKLDYADLDTVKDAINLSLNQAGFFGNTKNNTKDPKKSDQSTVNESDHTERLTVDKSTNSLVLYGTAAEAEMAKRIIAALDVATKQVSLEAKVIAVQKDAAKKLGIEWEWSKVPQYPEYTTSYETYRHTVQNADGSYTTVSEDVPKTTVTRHYNDGETIPGIISFGKSRAGYPFEFYYAATINALITDGKASVLARPNITTLQGHEAVINIGGEVPVPTLSVTNSTATTTMQYRQAGIILKYTPRINPDGGITATVHTEVSSPLYVDELKTYKFNKRSADTTVRLKDGETMVIGGLIGSEETRSVSKVPGLGDIPILGSFFRSIKKGKSDSEVMIFLTARVLPD